MRAQLLQMGGRELAVALAVERLGAAVRAAPGLELRVTAHARRAQRIRWRHASRTRCKEGFPARHPPAEGRAALCER